MAYSLTPVDLFLLSVFKPLNGARKAFRRCERRYDRLRIMQTATSYGLPLNIKKEKSFVNSKTHLGNNVSFNGMKIFGRGSVRIGNNFHSGYGCVILTSFHNYRSEVSIPYDSSYISGDVVIEDNVWLGNNVTVLGGVTIGEGAIIQINSVVTCDVPSCSIYGGHPARQFSERDQAVYEKLKSCGRFH